jgi:CRP/FNR family transcriptional regulator, nitrogen fixation regulation protein
MTSPWPSPAVMEALAVVTPCRRGEMIYASGDPVEHWYRIVSGLARKCSVTTDGRRQILDFLLPGDFFGFNAREKHPVTVEAGVEGTVVARYPRKRIESLANTDPQVGRYIRQMAFQALSRSQARMLILGRGTALDKVRSFLVELAERSPPGPAEALVLPMSRQEIADYLDLSVDAVSRALTELKGSGAITLTGRQRVTITGHSTSGQGNGSEV